MTKAIKKLLGRKNLFVLALGYSILITIAFLYPRISTTISSDLPLDKVVHIFLHAILIFMWLHFYFAYVEVRNAFALIATILGFCILYGIIIEVLQEVLTKDRQADFMDVLANIVGSILGIITFIKTKKV